MSPVESLQEAGYVTSTYRALLLRGSVTVENAIRTVIGGACAYEVFALSMKKKNIPTLSKMCRHSKSFEFLLLSTLVVHFHLERRIIDKIESLTVKEMCDAI